MRFYTVLPLAAALATAFVIPDEQTMNQVIIEDHHDESNYKSVKNSIDNAVDTAKDAIDSAVDKVYDATNEAADYTEEQYFDAESWLSEFNHAHERDFDYTVAQAEDFVHGHWDNMKAVADDWRQDLGFEPCHDKLGEKRSSGLKKLREVFAKDHEEDDDQRHRGPGSHDPHRDPHDDPHHHKPNMTVYQLISKSKYTTKLAALINQFPDVVDILNGTESNFTFFAPIDKAFEKIPDHGKEPPKEFLLKILQYHAVPDLYDAKRVLKSRTLSTVLEGDFLSEKPSKTPQRLSINLSLRGLTLNFYSRIIGANLFATNGIIHGIDSILVPPPKAAKIIEILPGEFSTLELGLFKTGLFSGLNNTDTHLGGTLFAPGNNAFKRLGPKATGFLFSRYGRKYLRALLEYHIVPNITLYSDALYTADGKGGEASQGMDAQRTFHIDLPTMLKDKYLSIDIARFVRFIDIRINGFINVAVLDGIAKDGVIQVVPFVIVPPKTSGILPPKTPGGPSEFVQDEMDVSDLVQRLEPYVKDDVESVDYVNDEDPEQEFTIQDSGFEL